MTDLAEELSHAERAEEVDVGKEGVALAVVPVQVEDTGRTTTLAPFDVSRQLPALLTLAKTLSTARGMIPAHLKSEGEIVAALLAGAELGIPPMASLRNIHLIDGKVGLDAGLQLGLLLRAGVRPQWVESSDRRAVLRLTRPGFAPHEQVYTIEDAKAAGLASKQNWQRHPKAMLRARCVSAAVKAYAADVVTGVYTPEELEDIRDNKGSKMSDPLTDQVVHDGHMEPERMEALKAKDAEHKAATKPIVDEWINEMLKPLVESAAQDKDAARRMFHAFVDHNGYTYTSGLHKSQQARAWAAIFRAFEKLTEAGCFEGHPYTADELRADLANAPAPAEVESEER